VRKQTSKEKIITVGFVLIMLSVLIIIICLTVKYDAGFQVRWEGWRAYKNKTYTIYKVIKNRYKDRINE